MSRGRARAPRPVAGVRDPAGGSRRGARARPLAALAVALAACGPPLPDAGYSTEAGVAVAHPLPPDAPERFAFGAPATAARTAAWDDDVGPDGVGLPPGSGTALEGAAVYARTCAACHGATGVEGPYDALVGGSWPAGGFPERRTVGSYWPWATTIYDYVQRAMPQDRPGVLSPDETYAVVAWILHRNGIVAEDAVLDATTLPQVAMPARDRFVPDDRTGGPRVR